jgi:phosphatidylserine decarboxylase
VGSEAISGILLALALSLPLAWKWELGVWRVGFAIAAIATFVALTAVATGLSGAAGTAAIAATTLAIGLTILAWRFYRDPERLPPARDDVVVSPADGEVVYVRESVGGVLPVATKHGRDYRLVELTKTPLRTEEAIVIGIAMSFLDVHVNRSPIAGRVKLRKHFSGGFGSLGKPRMVFENERATTVIERRGLEVAVVQIASRLVRQIAGFVGVEDEVALGQRIGVIRLGSQVDVVLPKHEMITVVVEAGQRIRAGESVLAKLAEAPDLQ